MKNSFKENYLKYKQPLLYVVFGFLTTVIGISVFALFTEWIVLDPLVANIISWIIAVLFAFITNRRFVFESSGNLVKEAFSFFAARIFTLLLEEAIIFCFVTVLEFNAMIIKTLAQIAVIVLNYLISKIFVFKKKQL